MRKFLKSFVFVTFFISCNSSTIDQNNNPEVSDIKFKEPLIDFYIEDNPDYAQVHLKGHANEITDFSLIRNKDTLTISFDRDGSIGCGFLPHLTVLKDTVYVEYYIDCDQENIIIESKELRFYYKIIDRNNDLRNKVFYPIQR